MTESPTFAKQRQQFSRTIDRLFASGKVDQAQKLIEQHAAQVRAERRKAAAG